jgi:hypothetical protein
MEGYEQLSQLRRVKAPPDFEERVLTLLPDGRRARARRRTVIRLAFAGATTAVLAGFVVLNVFVLNKTRPFSVVRQQKTEDRALPEAAPSPAVLERAGAASVPMLEKVDYSSELRNVSYEPQTVYILEQVSEGTPSGIKF